MKKEIKTMLEKVKEICEIIFKHRYLIAIVIFILCILLEISGSSIGMWDTYMKTDTKNTGIILGQPRPIRSDEWAVFTPMTFSQEFNRFEYFSNIPRGSNTDVSLVYALPISNFIQIFRPFQIGYLFLGIAKGLSFFWCGRFIALFLVMLELAMLITNKNKPLSVIATFLITLSPGIQWWFAVCGIAEMLIFGGLAVILLDKYMLTSNFKKRILYLLLMYICAGGYILVFYPSWQIPMFYVFLALAIWVFIKNWKQCKMTLKDFISIGLVVTALVLTMGYILYNSIDTIQTIMNTVYPGSRKELGGNSINEYFQYPMNIFLPFKDIGNSSEASTIFTLFPMGLIIAGLVVFKEKKKDKLLTILLIAYTILSIWCIFGFPEILAKLTLLSNSQAKRSFLAVGILEILILIRGLSIIKKPVNRKLAIIIAVVASLLLVGISSIINRNYVKLIMVPAMIIMCIYLFYMILRYRAKNANYCLLLGIIFVMIMIGGTINPIQKGVKFIYQSNLMKEIQNIQSEDNGKWIVENMGFPITNYTLMAGVPTVNSTNIYPDLEKWHQIDEEKQFEDIYNRYAHIKINLKTNDEIKEEEKFRLLYADSFEVDLTPEELEKLEIKYIFTDQELEQYNTDLIHFDKKYQDENYYIYKLEKQ